jgi:hypothetical protein
VTLAWIDDRLDSVLGGAVVLTGTLVGLVLAYVVRFMSLAVQSAESQLARIPAQLDEAARSLGASPSRILSEVHLPLLTPGITTAALLVFVEVMKELPATVLLRPVRPRHPRRRGVGGDARVAVRDRGLPGADHRGGGTHPGRDPRRLTDRRVEPPVVPST